MRDSHVFVLSEDASEFPAEIRMELVKKGCSDLKTSMFTEALII